MLQRKDRRLNVLEEREAARQALIPHSIAKQLSEK